MDENGFVDETGNVRKHHEIYLSDPRKTAPEKLRTVLRHPVSPKKAVHLAGTPVPANSIKWEKLIALIFPVLMNNSRFFKRSVSKDK